MIEILEVSKSYGNKRVLANVTASLPEKKVIAFIGSNGAGKSTLLSLISRLLFKDSGAIRVDGTEVGDWDSRELAKKLAVLRQNNQSDIKFTVRELVSFGRFPHSRGRLTAADEEKIDQALVYMDIADIQHRFMDELSGGQRQMAYIAMVIAQDTDYILLDEPLNNLDIRHSVGMMRTLRRLVEDMGKTVLIVIHDINFVSCHADYVLALRDGRLVACGDKEAVITPAVLEKIYGLDIDIRDYDGDKICVYFR